MGVGALLVIVRERERERERERKGGRERVGQKGDEEARVRSEYYI